MTLAASFLASPASHLPFAAGHPPFPPPRPPPHPPTLSTSPLSTSSTLHNSSNSSLPTARATAQETLLVRGRRVCFLHSQEAQTPPSCWPRRKRMVLPFPLRISTQRCVSNITPFSPSLPPLPAGLAICPPPYRPIRPQQHRLPTHACSRLLPDRKSVV